MRVCISDGRTAWFYSSFKANKRHRRSQGGTNLEGHGSAPMKPRLEYIFKLHRVSLFSARTPLGELTAALRASGVPPRQIPGYAYDKRLR